MSIAACRAFCDLSSLAPVELFAFFAWTYFKMLSLSNLQAESGESSGTRNGIGGCG